MLRANLNRARNFHQRFRDLRVDNCHPLTFTLFGRGNRTDIFYDDVALNRSPQARTLQGVSGDGTVAEASAQFLNARPPARYVFRQSRLQQGSLDVCQSDHRQG